MSSIMRRNGWKNPVYFCGLNLKRARLIARRADLSLRRLRGAQSLSCPQPWWPRPGGCTAHQTKLVKDYVLSAKGRRTLHFVPGYAPELNPDELVWSYVKRTGLARTPLHKGERLKDKIEAQLASIKNAPRLVRSFFRAPTVAYITDC